LEFGLSNLLVATLFWSYILTRCTAMKVVLLAGVRV
jgi:hypothetical protein